MMDVSTINAIYMVGFALLALCAVGVVSDLREKWARDFGKRDAPQVLAEVKNDAE